MTRPGCIKGESGEGVFRSGALHGTHGSLLPIRAEGIELLHEIIVQIETRGKRTIAGSERPAFGSMIL